MTKNSESNTSVNKFVSTLTAHWNNALFLLKSKSVKSKCLMYACTLLLCHRDTLILILKRDSKKAWTDLLVHTSREYYKSIIVIFKAIFSFSVTHVLNLIGQIIYMVKIGHSAACYNCVCNGVLVPFRVSSIPFSASLCCSPLPTL